MPRRVRMSPVDTAWLRMDRESNRMAIKGVLVLDRPLDQAPDWARLRAVLQQRLVQRFPRFAQRVVHEEHDAWWEDDPSFSIDRHLRRRRLGAGSPSVALQRLVSRLATEPLREDRPLWQVDVIPRFESGSAVVVRIHHCIADGIALIGVMLSLTDPVTAADDKDRSTRARRPGAARSRWATVAGVEAPDDQALSRDPWAALLDPLTQEAVDSLDIARAIRSRYERIAADPQAAARFGLQSAGLLGEMLKLLVLPHDSETRFKGRTAQAKQVAWAPPLSLSDVRALSRFLACSVNDVLLSCVAGALRRYLIEHGDPVEGVEVRTMVPVNLRRGREWGQAGELGNRFGLVTLLLPVHEAHPLMRVREVQRRMGELKVSMLPPLSLGLLGLMGLAPRSVQGAALEVLASKATAVTTNVPGPTAPRSLAGARIEQLLFWVPQSGDIGLGVSILSYAGSVQFGLITDEGLVPDPQRVAALFEREFQDLLYGTLMSCP